jgi:hypothetical protein
MGRKVTSDRSCIVVVFLDLPNGVFGRCGRTAIDAQAW